MAKTSKLNLYGLQNRTLLYVLTYFYLFILTAASQVAALICTRFQFQNTDAIVRNKDSRHSSNGSVGVLGGSAWAVNISDGRWLLANRPVRCGRGY